MIRMYNNSVLNKVKQINLNKLDIRGKNLSKIKQITWNDIDNFINYLTNIIKENKYKSVFGIPRVGLMFAILLSLKTNIPITMTITNDTLVIDDDTISGLNIIPYYDKADIAVYGCCDDVIIKPKYIFQIFSHNELPIWPWEK